MNSIQHNSWGQGALGALGETLPRGLSEDLRIRGPLRNSSYADCAFPLLPHPFLLALAPRSIKWEYPMIWAPCVMRWWPLFPFSTSHIPISDYTEEIARTKKININSQMIQQFHFWVYIGRKSNHYHDEFLHIHVTAALLTITKTWK